MKKRTASVKVKDLKPRKGGAVKGGATSKKSSGAKLT